MCALALGLQGVAFALSPDVASLSSASHPLEATWYDDDSADVAWTGGLPLTVSVDSTATARASAVSGGYLYVAMGSEGVAVYDVSDPAAPVLVGQDDGSVPFARDVAVSGQTLVVLTQSGTGGLVALDISDPVNPAYVASATVPNGGGSDLELIGDVLYVTQANGLSSFCVRDPGAPMLMGSSASTGVTLDCTVSGRTAFAATGSAFLYAWDVTIPGAIGSYATIPTGANTANVAAAGAVLYVSVSNAIQVWDVSDPSAPTMLDSYATSWDPGGLAILGTRLVCRAHEGGIHVLDASDPSALSELATIECGPGWEPVTVDEGCVYAGTPDGFDVVCAAAPDVPKPVSAVVLPGLLGIETWDRYAYPFHWRIGAYDMTDPAAPVALPEYLAIGSAVYDFDICDGLGAVADDSGIVQILRVADDGSLSLASAVAFGGPAMLEVEFEGRTAIFFQQSTGYRIVDVTNPVLPGLLGFIPDVSTDGGMARHGDVLFTASTSGGIRAFDVGTIVSPVLLDTFDAPLAENDIAASGGVAVVTGSSPARIAVLDVSDPSAITLAATVDLTDHPSWVDVRGTTAYVSTQADLIAFDVSDPAAPVELWRLTQGADGLRECAFLGGDHLVTLWEGAGLRTFDRMFDPAGFSVTVDQSAETTPDATPETAETSMTVSALPDGVNYVHVSAVDDVGRIGAPVHRALRVDTHAPSDPALSSTTPTGTPQTDNTISVALAGATDGAGSGVAGYSVRWNQGSAAQADTAADYAADVATVPSGIVSDGSWYCNVRTVDAMDHWTAGTTIGPFVVDATNPSAPSVSSSTHPVAATWYSVDEVTLSWDSTDANGIGGYSWVWDTASGTIPDLTSEGTSETVSYSGVADGLWYFHVRARDGAGNWGSTTHRAVRVDTTAPAGLTLLESDVQTGTPSAVTQCTVGLSGAGDGGMSGIAGYAVSWSASAVETPSAALTHDAATTEVKSPELGDGTWYAHARVCDVAGNWSEAVHLGLFVFDTLNPTTPSLESATHPDQGSWYSADDVTLSWGSTDANGIAGYSWVWDTASGTIPDLTSEGTSETVSYSGVADGLWYFHVRARDGAGNWSSTATRSVRVDTTEPVTTSNAQATYTGTATVLLTPTDSGAGIAGTRYQLDGGAETSGTVVTCSVYGAHTVRFWSVDHAGNTESVKSAVFSVVSGATTYVEVAGGNRYQTALDACRHAFTSAPAVVLATGENWPDALGGAALAGAAGGPILLTEPGRLTAGVLDQIRALGATKVYLLGGSAAISTSVENALESALGPGDQVTRMGGSNRFGTARLVAAEAARLQGPGYDGTVFVATGTNFPDALAASPVSAAKGWPILLCDAGGLDASSYALLSAIGAKEAYLLGGTAVVPTSVQQRLATLLGPTRVHRLEGGDRYATGVKIARQGVAEGLTWDHLAIGTGENFPDALAGGVMQGKLGSVVLLTETDRLPSSVRAELVARADLIGEVCYLGGTGAVSESVRAAVRAALH